MNERPTVSVVMLAYNHEAYIDEAIRGVLGQQCEFSIELVIGEDNSSDRTQAIIEDYVTRHPNVIRLLTADTNVGMHANFERVIRAARGEFIAICEGDDYWTDRTKLQAQVAFLRTNASFGGVYTHFRNLRQTRFGWRASRSIFPTPMLPNESPLDRLLCRGNFMGTATVMYRTELVKGVFDSALRPARFPYGDYPTNVYVASQAKIGELPQVTTLYRTAPGSATNLGPEKNLRDAIAAGAMRSEFCVFVEASEETRLIVAYGVERDILSTALVARDYDIAQAAADRLRAFHDRGGAALRGVDRLKIAAASRPWLAVAIVRLIAAAKRMARACDYRLTAPPPAGDEQTPFPVSN